MPSSRHDVGPHPLGPAPRAAAPDVGRVVGRYVLYDEIASGGMASVYFGRMTGAVGFSRTVAVKRLHPHLAKDPDFVAMILDEARLAARIVHPNVVSTLDVVTDGPAPGEVYIVMEYMQGESLSRLQRALWARGQLAPVATAATLMGGVLHGLHAAHEATSEHGAPLAIVHRDVSPQNVMVGADGSVRLLDFGVAKAAGRIQSTREGSIKGKIPYMAPEQIRGGAVSRVSDVYAASVVLWELLTGRRLFEADNEVILIQRITAPEQPIAPPSQWNPLVPPRLDEIVLRGLAHRPEQRFATAREMARALELAAPLVPASSIGEWVQELAADALLKRAAIVAAIESQPSQLLPGAAPVGSAPLASTLRMAEVVRGGAQDFAQTLKDNDTLGTHAGAALSSETRRAASLRKRAVIAAMLLTVCGGIGGLALWLGQFRTAPNQPVADAVVASDSPAPPERPAAASSELPTPLPAASSLASQPPTPASAASAAPAPAASVAAAPKHKRRISCNPPFDVDANGIKTYKRECLK